MYNNNAQQLNTTTILPIDTNNNYQENNKLYEYNKNINLINSIFNNSKTNHFQNNKNKININNKYRIQEYLGEGIQGSLYTVFDKNNKKYICKKIVLNSQTNPNQTNQLQFELNLLNFLSSNKTTRKYVNPCLEYRTINNQVFTLFPIFNGYSLYHLKKYLFKMNHTNYYNMLFHLIKVILFGMAKIHQHNIAHQNINENSILVSTYENTDDMKIKFTDFGLGCGINNNKDSYINNMMLTINKCSTTDNLINLTSTQLKKVKPNNNLFISQKKDIISLSVIFIQLLLFFEKIDLDLTKGYTNNSKEQIKQIIIDKYISNINKLRKSKNYVIDELMFLNTNDEIKKDIMEYLSIFNDYVLCEDKKIQDCQYILDKLIIYEKYKNEEF
jgi:serine/threonine protein kinase